MCYFGCCFNDTATTEIYTYGHTLSRHDALPISAALRRHAQSARRPYGASARDRGTSPRSLGSRRSNSIVRSRWAERSEEHTSELQSLMRISYAVFCLKNKTHEPQPLDSLPQNATNCIGSDHKSNPAPNAT